MKTFADLQMLVEESHDKHYKSTSLADRLKDIKNESIELLNFRDLTNLHEEFGDLLWSLLQLATETGIDPVEAVMATIKKLDARAEGKKS